MMRAKWSTLVRLVVSCTTAVPLFAVPASSSGSGFAVTPDGLIVTNAHVVGQCTEVFVRTGTRETSAQLVALDLRNDLALLKSDLLFQDVPVLRSAHGPVLGEDVQVYGFPAQGVLSSSVQLTKGNVSATVGPLDDSRMFQFTAPIQPGSSGGPVTDGHSSVVGIVVSKLSSWWAAQNLGEIPQNVNFGIKGSVVRDFLESRGIRPVPSPLAKETDEIRILSEASVEIRCTPPEKSATAGQRSPRGGVLVAGYGSPYDFFRPFFIDLQNALASMGVRVANDSTAALEGADSLTGMLRYMKDIGADSLLYLTVTRSGMNIRRVDMTCYSPDGQILWQDQASNGHQIFGSGEQSIAAYVLKEAKKKLQPRVGKPGLPLRTTVR